MSVHNHRDASGLTTKEKRCIDLTVDLWNAFSELPVQHSGDQAEMMRDVHDIQHRIMARVARRSDPDLFRNESGE